MSGKKEFYVFPVSPEGVPDPALGPAGPFAEEEAAARTWPPDPLSGWRTIAVKITHARPVPGTGDKEEG